MKILVGLIFMLALNTLIFLSQTAVGNLAVISGEQTPILYDMNGTFIDSYNTGNNTINENITDGLPTGGYNVQPTTGNFFIDPFVTFKNWLLDIKGVRYFVAYVNAFPNFLKSLQTVGLPIEVAFALGFLWHAFAWFLFILFLRGLV